MQDFMDIVRALSDENRLRALYALKDRELCVCQIIALLELAPSTVSKHMSVLRQARLVEARKNGRWMHYRLPGKQATRQVRESIAWVLRSITNIPEMCRDKKRLEKILKTDPTELCRKQNKCVCARSMI